MVDLLAVAVVGPQGLALAAHVVLDDTVGGVQNISGGAIVLFQTDRFCPGENLLKVEDIFNRSTAKFVDRLVIVANDADVVGAARQQPHQMELRNACVLVLVHQDIAELRPVACKHLRTVAEKQKGIEQQIVEIHGIRLPATLPVAAVNIAYGRHLGRTIAFVGFFVVGIARRRHEVVLGIGDTCLHRTRFIHFLVQSHLLDD